MIAAITSCTNTSNPYVLIGAGLLARKAVELGVRQKPWVKTSLAPGSRVVMDYLERADLLEPLEKLGFELVGFGCTTCIGNSGPLLPGVSEAVKQGSLSVAVRAFGQPQLRGARAQRGPPQLPRIAAAGRRLRTCRAPWTSTRSPIRSQRLQTARPVTLADLWPSEQRWSTRCARCVTSAMYQERYGVVFFEATNAGLRSRRRPARPSTGTRIRRTCSGRPTSIRWDPTQSLSKRSTAPGSSRWSETASPPTTSRRQDRSPPTPPPRGTSRHTVWHAPISTHTVRGAATTR